MTEQKHTPKRPPECGLCHTEAKLDTATGFWFCPNLECVLGQKHQEKRP